MRKKHKSFAHWQHGVDNKFKAKNMEEEKKELGNLGLIYEPIAPDDWQLGDAEFGREVVIANGDWTPYLPTGEEQALAGLETMSCVSQSACKNIEMIMNKMLEDGKISPANRDWAKANGYFDGNGHWNFSGRAIAKLSGTTRNGNSLKNVGETIRKIGLAPESKWPFVAGMTWNEYYKYPSGEVIKLGRDFLERFQINYEVVPEAQFAEGFKYAPLQTAAHAWCSLVNGIFQRCNGALNHAISIFKRDSNLITSIFDHYKLNGSFIKLAAKDFNFMDYGYRYLITEKNPQTPAPKPYGEDVVFITPCAGYLNHSPALILEKGTGLNKNEAMAWVPSPKVGESLPSIQWEVDPSKKEESGWQLLLKAIKKLLGYGR